jgi:hypothetical protein
MVGAGSMPRHSSTASPAPGGGGYILIPASASLGSGEDMDAKELFKIMSERGAVVHYVTPPPNIVGSRIAWEMLNRKRLHKCHKDCPGCAIERLIKNHTKSTQLPLENA